MMSCQPQTPSEQEYLFRLSEEEAIQEGHLAQGTQVSPSGHSFTLNSKYYVKDGQPWYPVMGEMHYHRVPRSDWEESILKMKASGVNIIQSYVFWIAHEERENEWNWSGNRDLRHFLELCKKHGMYVWLRIGPWCHGEARNGGFPDWIQQLEGGNRNDNPAYLRYSKRFYEAVGQQAKGYLFKEDGPVIGVQIENEFAFDTPEGLNHMLTLKRMAVEAGFDVPYYTATGWPKGDLRQTELVPVYGGYPEAPWDGSTEELPLSINYVFSSWANDPSVGTDLLGEQETSSSLSLQYPFSLAELGGGVQLTYHRRPIIAAKDVATPALVKVGSGANLLGYYMYHGGSNPIGKYSTMQESKGSGYPNDCPVISYDFQAPIGERGILHGSYQELKTLHAFLADYGDRVAVTDVCFGENPVEDPNENRLRVSVRHHGESGFVFLSNYQRLLDMPDREDVRVHIRQTDGEEFRFPALWVAAGDRLILPYGMDMNGCLLRYATVQPLYLLHNEIPTYVFFTHEGTAPELAFEAKSVHAITLDKQSLNQDEEGIYRVLCEPNETQLIELEATNGAKSQLLILTEKQALHSWKIRQGGQEAICLTKAELIQFEDEALRLRNVDQSHFEMCLFPASTSCQWEGEQPMKQETDGYFSKLSLALPKVELQAEVAEVTDPSPFIPKQPKLPKDDKKADLDLSRPGPRYDTNFTPYEGARYYTIAVPTFPKGISCAYMRVDYLGDTGALYQKGELVADDFYSSIPMPYRLDRTALSHPESFLFQVIPFSPEVKIYLDPSARTKLSQGETGLSSVRIQPVYDAIMRLTATFNEKNQ